MASLRETEGSPNAHLAARLAERADQNRLLTASLERLEASLVCLVAWDGRAGVQRTLAALARDPEALREDRDRIVRSLSGSPKEIALSSDGNAWLRRLFRDREAVAASAYAFARGGLPDGLAGALRESVHLRHALACPLVVWGRVRGLVVWLDGRPFENGRVEEAALFAEHIRVAWENTRLRVLAGLKRRQQRIFQAGMMRAEDRLRRDLAEALHGRVQTRLLVAAERIQAVAASLGDVRPDVARELGQVRDILEEMREQEIRPLSHQLHPGLLRLGLRAALFGLIRSWEETVSVRLEVDSAIETLDDPLDNRLSETRRLTLYRVAEEAISNAVRHGRASRVNIGLRTERSHIVLTVEDDGRGVDPAHLRPGWGLSSMAARLNWSNGSFTLRPGPDRGAVLTAWMPIPERKESTVRAVLGVRTGH